VPHTWKELETHQFGLEFKAAAHKEYSDLDRKGTFRTVPAEEVKRHFVIPVMWVFTYKFDKDGFSTRGCECTDPSGSVGSSDLTQGNEDGGLRKKPSATYGYRSY
jgi:hypothetical protein